jgi:hypothetical protein
MTREQSGPFGIKAVGKIPVVAGGSGSLTAFNFTLHRLFTYKGEKHSYASARCADGHLNAHAIARFADGTELAGTLQTPCRTKGG